MACSAVVNPAPTTIPDEPTSVLVPPDDPVESIGTLRHFAPEATFMSTDLTEARPLIRTELNVKTHDGGQLISGLVDCVATLDFVSEDSVRRFSLSTRKFENKAQVRLANCQRVTFSIVYDTTFELARHEFQRIFYVLRDLRAADVVLGLPWQNDEQASTQVGTTRIFTLMGGTLVETEIEDRRLDCLLLPSGKIQKLMRKTRRSKERNADFHFIHVSPAARKTAEFHT
jgi:hypothetical protein